MNIHIFVRSTNWDTEHNLTAGIEIPKYVDTVTPEYKPKFDALVRNYCSCHAFFSASWFYPQLGRTRALFPCKLSLPTSDIYVLFIPLFYFLCVGGWTERGRENLSERVGEDR
jgi:hypothetical protein